MNSIELKKLYLKIIDFNSYSHAKRFEAVEEKLQMHQGRNNNHDDNNDNNHNRDDDDNSNNNKCAAAAAKNKTEEIIT